MASTRSVKSNELYFFALIQWLNILMQHNDVIHSVTFKIFLYLYVNAFLNLRRSLQFKCIFYVYD
jgi:hypothetical protein